MITHNSEDSPVHFTYTTKNLIPSFEVRIAIPILTNQVKIAYPNRKTLFVKVNDFNRSPGIQDEVEGE